MRRYFNTGYKVWPVRGASLENCWVCEPVTLTKAYIITPGQMRFVPVCIQPSEISKEFRMIAFDEPVVDKMIRNSEDADYMALYYFGFLVQA